MTSQLPNFWCLFLSYQLQKNTHQNGAAVRSLRPFLFRDNFINFKTKREISSKFVASSECILNQQTFSLIVYNQRQTKLKSIKKKF